MNPFSWDTSAGDPEDSSSFTHSDKQRQMVTYKQSSWATSQGLLKQLGEHSCNLVAMDTVGFAREREVFLNHSAAHPLILKTKTNQRKRLQRHPTRPRFTGGLLPLIASQVV